MNATDTIRALEALRREVLDLHTNYVGQEGRGAAHLFQRDVVRLIDRRIRRIRETDALAQAIAGAKR